MFMTGMTIDADGLRMLTAPTTEALTSCRMPASPVMNRTAAKTPGSL